MSVAADGAEGDPKTNKSWMTLPFLENASYWTNWAVVGLTLLAATAGVLALIFSSRLAVAKDAALQRFQTESAVAISSANERAAEANRIAAETNERAALLEKQAAEARGRQVEAELRLEQLRRRQDPRRLNVAAFQKALESKPKLRVEILYQPDDTEANMLAIQILAGLITAGWGVSFPAPIAPGMSSKPEVPAELLGRLARRCELMRSHSASPL